ncbi:MAG: EF-hand domain protein, partial [Caulobacter sp.]|nr:EF-hand domain protein [Caulobacter sp.]
GGGSQGDGPPGGGRPPGANMTGAAAYTFLKEPEPVTASDGNFDHLITAAEFAAAADRRFKLLDKDGDGALTLDTLPPTAVQRMGPGGGPGGERGGRGGGRHRPPGRQG